MSWSIEQVSDMLHRAGVEITREEIRLEQRQDRHLLRLPGGRLAWFASNIAGRQRMARERRVLRLIASRCSFRVPAVLFESSDGHFDLRAGVTGLEDPWRLYERMKLDPMWCARTGLQLGAILAEQHTRIRAEDAAGWLPSLPAWPDPALSIRERLPRVVTDRSLLARIDELLTRYEAISVAEDDHVLIHGDFGFHNLVVGAETLGVRGIFDYDGGAWADRHHDFRYLLFDVERDEILEAALAAYEPVVGRKLSRERIRVYNAVCSASYLAFRDGVPPDEKWCGRTLAEDLRWIRVALARCS
jgi:hypothetical protein